MYCECGCGQETPLARQTAKSKGWIRGQPLRFINGHNKRLAIKVDPNATEKACAKCGEIKPISEFHRKSGVRHGHNARCRDCTADDQKQIDRRKYRHVQDAWVLRNPEKARAHRAVNKAIRSGILIRPNSCSSCLDETKPQAHHEDYDEPLVVIWLCPRCHKKVHRVD